MEQRRKTVTIQLLPYFSDNRVRIFTNYGYDKTFNTLTQACKELSEQDVISQISRSMYNSDSRYDINSIDYKDGSIHYNPARKQWPYTGSVYGFNSSPMTSALKVKRWITKTMNEVSL